MTIKEEKVAKKERKRCNQSRKRLYEVCRCLSRRGKGDNLAVDKRQPIYVPCPSLAPSDAVGVEEWGGGQ
jgi:hypothetical protein